MEETLIAIGSLITGYSLRWAQVRFIALKQDSPSADAPRVVWNEEPQVEAPRVVVNDAPRSSGISRDDRNAGLGRYQDWKGKR